MSIPTAVLYGDAGTLADIIDTELEFARGTFPPFNSAHEGYAVIAEELDELWQEVKANKGGTGKINEPQRMAMRKEAIQVAAMAMRFALDLT